MKPLRPSIVLVVLGAGLWLGPGSGAEIPARSRERADRFQGWTATLDRAAAAVDEGRTERAEALYREVLEGAGAEGRPNLPLARAADGLADLYRSTEAVGRAIPLYRRAADLWEQLLGPAQPRLAVTLHNLGVSYAALGDWRAAEEALRRALVIWEASLGAESAEARNTRRAYDSVRRRIGSS